MASIIKIKRSGTSGAPSSLKLAEFAYSYLGGTQSNGGDRLYIGTGGVDGSGNANNIDVVGGKYFTDRLDHVEGTLTASSAIITDTNSKIDNLKVDNIDINGNTIVTLGSDNDATGTITLKGVSDSSTVVINTADEAADAGSPIIDLSSGSVASSSAGEIFEYSVKFLNGVPVAIDGNVTITNFDAAIDRIVIKTETLPAGYSKDSLLSTSGVDVATGIDSTRIDFGVNADGSSGSIVIEGVDSSDLALVDLTFSIDFLLAPKT